MVFVGAAIFPHGTMAFDGAGDQSSSESSRIRFNGLPEPLKNDLSSLFAACMKTAESIAKVQPDVVVLHTPHGISLSGSLGVYLNSMAKGDALWNGQWTEFQVELPLHKQLAEKLLQQFQAEGIDAEGVNCFALTEAPLRWGEVVPAWYLQQAFKKLGFQPKYVVLSQSLKRHGAEVNSKRLNIGACLAQVIQNIDERVLVAISGDLAHTHAHNYGNLPLYLPDPRWSMQPSSSAEVFDRAVEGWARGCSESLFNSSDPLPKCDGPMNWDATFASKWLNFAVELHPTALSCGIGGFLVLHGLLLQYSGLKTTQSQCFGRFAPTYYGMMPVVFLT